jgi:partner of Y14 and mago protein
LAQSSARQSRRRITGPLDLSPPNLTPFSQSPHDTTMPTVETPSVSRAGIATTANGERHIPSSVRPDGTLRKEIRVRPGYRPPEDVELYKNRTAEGFRNRGKAGVPGAESLKADEDPTKLSAAANKNAKRREARKKAAAAATDGKEAEEKAPEKKEIVEAVVEPEKPKDPEAEKEKEAKKLMKKLRQAKELKDKKEKGDKLLPEQFEKVIKINELIRQLETLGFDAQGEKKPET